MIVQKIQNVRVAVGEHLGMEFGPPTLLIKLVDRLEEGVSYLEEIEGQADKSGDEQKNELAGRAITRDGEMALERAGGVAVRKILSAGFGPDVGPDAGLMMMTMTMEASAGKGMYHMELFLIPSYTLY